MDFGCSAEDTHHKLLLNALHCSTTAKTQHSNTGSPGERGKSQNSYFLTFFTFMLAVLPQDRSGSSPGMSGMSAPLACREGHRKSREVKTQLQALDFASVLHGGTNLKYALVEFCLLTRENWPLGWGSERWQLFPAPSLANPWYNCEIQYLIHCYFCFLKWWFSEVGVKKIFPNSILGLLIKYLIFQTSVYLDSGRGTVKIWIAHTVENKLMTELFICGRWTSKIDVWSYWLKCLRIVKFLNY